MKKIYQTPALDYVSINVELECGLFSSGESDGSNIDGKNWSDIVKDLTNL